MKILSTSILLALLFICQSCTVYHKTPVPIEDAVDKGKVKLVKTTIHEGQATKETKDFSNIIYEDTGYFGLTHVTKHNNFNTSTVSSLAKTQISIDDSTSLYLKNKKASTLKSIFVPVGIVAATIAAFIGYSVATLEIF